MSVTQNVTDHKTPNASGQQPQGQQREPRGPLHCSVQCPLLKQHVCVDGVRLEPLTERLGVVRPTNEQDRPGVELKQVLKPASFPNSVRRFDCGLDFPRVAVSKEAGHSDVIVLDDSKGFSFFTRWIAVAVRKLQGVSHLLAD